MPVMAVQKSGTKKLNALLKNPPNRPLDVVVLRHTASHEWQLFFKWIKQHLRITHFLDTSENAVKTQIWYAVWTYVRIAIIK